MKVSSVNNIAPKVELAVKNKSQIIRPTSKQQPIPSKTSSSGFFELLLDKIKKLFGKKQQVVSQPENKIFELEKFIYNPVLVGEFFKAYPNLDLNAKDKNGLTLLLRAVDRGDERFIRILGEISKEYDKEIDWNVTDNDFNNAAMRNINKKGATGLQDVLLGRVDVDYINPKTKLTLFQEAILKNHEGYISSIIDGDYENSEKFDINQTHHDTPPAFFLALNNTKSYYIGKMLREHSIDLDAQYKGKTVFEYIDINKCKNIEYTSMEILQTHLLKKDLKKMKEYYDKEGYVDLDQILEYVKLPRFSKICNEPLNSIDENIGHFVADIVPKTFDEIKKISEIVDLLADAEYDFNGVDGINRTAITKSIEANNLVVFKILYHKLDQLTLWGRAKVPEIGINIRYIDELKKNNITDPEWYNFIDPYHHYV